MKPGGGGSLVLPAVNNANGPLALVLQRASCEKCHSDVDKLHLALQNAFYCF